MSAKKGAAAGAAALDRAAGVRTARLAPSTDDAPASRTRRAPPAPRRCDWCLGNELYMAYHDTEWGVPVHEDRGHFEFLVLEGAQAGLSWLTVLRKRDSYRKAFDNFDPARVARYNDRKIEGLLADPGIVRNRRKVESAITNARAFLAVQKEFGTFDRYLWGFVDGKPVRNRWKSISEIPATSDLAERVSADLKKRGFRFVGPTIIYAHLQAIGVINDHIASCFRYRQL